MASGKSRPADEGLSRGKPQRTAALAVSAGLHGLCLALCLAWADRADLPEPAAAETIAVVFAAPAAAPTPEPPAPESPAPEPPVAEPAEPETPATPATAHARPEPAAPQPVITPETPPPAAEPTPVPPLPVPEPPPPRPGPRPHPVVKVPSRPAPAPTRPAQAAPAALAPEAHPPASAVSPAPAAPPSAGWRQALGAWLIAHKTYPDPARQRGIEGTVGLRFTLDRAGHVIDVAVSRSSGSTLLDSAAEAMLRNATLPAPDPAQDQITISVQLHYQLTDR